MQSELYNRYEDNQLDRSSQLQVGIIGLGNMGTAFMNGLTAIESFNGQVFVCSRTGEETIARLKNEVLSSKIQIGENNFSVIDASDIIFLCLKQGQMKEELMKWRESGLLLKDKLLVSCAAGIRIDTIKKWLGNDKQPVARVMPNTPASVGRGVFGWTVSDEVTVGQKNQLEDLFSRIGTEFYVRKESDIDIITALSGSGPAYIYFLVEHMIQSAIEMGLDLESAEIIARQTLIGAAALLEANSELSIKTLRKNITSPKGTTEAAIAQLTSLGFELGIKEAMRAAKKRAGEIALEYDYS
ncbi:MAG: pyrroline-5-carboxylate reductase [Candidatus Levybacteria bacterium]|nr:pyrroline-5-carboxylate reductase [Candidatus Levybacteria bacterium]